MGLDYFYGNQSKESNIVINRSMYFGDIYREPKKRCFSNEKTDINQKNNKTIHNYFPNKSQNISYKINEKLLNSIKKDDDSPNISSSSSTISSSSNDEIKKSNKLIKKRADLFLRNNNKNFMAMDKTFNKHS